MLSADSYTAHKRRVELQELQTPYTKFTNVGQLMSLLSQLCHIRRMRAALTLCWYINGTSD